MSRDVSEIQYKTETDHRKMTSEEIIIVRNWRNEWIHQIRWALDLIEQNVDSEHNLIELLGGMFGLVVGLEEVLVMYGPEQQTPVIQWTTMSDSESENGGSNPPGSTNSIDAKENGGMN